MQLRQLCVELGDRIALRRSRTLRAPLPGRSGSRPRSRAPGPSRGRRGSLLRRRAGDQHQHRLGLGEAGEVVEIAVEAVRGSRCRGCASRSGAVGTMAMPAPHPREHCGAPACGRRVMSIMSPVGLVGCPGAWPIELDHVSGRSSASRRAQALGRADVDPAAACSARRVTRPRASGRAQQRRERSCALPGGMPPNSARRDRRRCR